ncbi:MAG: PKD domain-containing protein [Weeksellaceae bacterium]|nr:PKD domain-containing protein [Weeksellaceae bacterium]
MKIWLVILLFIVGMLQIKAEYPMSAGNNGQTYNTCYGIFTDDGGVSGNYSNDISNRTMTFCPENPTQLLRMNFTQFHTEANYDVLSVFFGTSATGTPFANYSGNLQPFVITAQTPGQCLTFRFNSDWLINYSGWRAQISCVAPCVPPVAQLVGGNEDEYICYAEGANVVSLDASASYSNQPGYPISQYYWDWGDGTSTTTTSPIAQHTYADNPGYYQVQLRVRTAYTAANPGGCYSDAILKKIAILPPPDFAGTSAAVLNVNCGENVNLVGVAASQTIVTLPPRGTGSTAALPDNINNPFISTIDLSGFFPEGATLTTSCFPRITLNLEHSYAGDLQIYLRAPSGQEIFLFNGYDDPGVDAQSFGYCVNAAHNGVPGCVAPYHIVNTGGLVWGNASSRHNVSQPCSVWGGPCGARPYFRQNQNFNSSQSMNGLLGTPLNGIWTLRIVDRLAYDDGILESWSISFPNTCYSALEHLTPVLSGGLWSHDGNGPAVSDAQTVSDTPHPTIGIMPCPTGQNCVGNQLSNTQIVGPFNMAGSYTYTYTVQDEFGCEYQRTTTVNVNAGPAAIFPDMQTQYCLGDTAQDLPMPSNGVLGQWVQDSISTSEVGVFTYSFLQNCHEPFEVPITVHPKPILNIIQTYN